MLVCVCVWGGCGSKRWGVIVIGRCVLFGSEASLSTPPQILRVLGESAIAVRTKAMKCLSEVVAVDPSILARVRTQHASEGAQLAHHATCYVTATAWVPIQLRPFAVSLCLCLSLCMSLALFLSLCLSLSFSLTLSLSLSLSHSFFFPPFLSHLTYKLSQNAKNKHQKEE